MKTVVWDSRSLENLPPYTPPPSEYDKYRWKKYGRLRVLRVHAKRCKRPYPGSKPQLCDCLCECGRIVTLPWYRVKMRLQKSCGYAGCPYFDAELEGKEPPSIIARCNPLYECPAPSAGCIISELYHICCCECDRPCKSCLNSPGKCGTKKRK